MIFGLPQDTAEDLDRLVRWQDRIGIDYCFFIPLTPNPGTAMADSGSRNACSMNCVSKVRVSTAADVP